MWRAPAAGDCRGAFGSNVTWGILCYASGRRWKEKWLTWLKESSRNAVHQGIRRGGEGGYDGPGLWLLAGREIYFHWNGVPFEGRFTCKAFSQCFNLIEIASKTLKKR